ncbi:diaminopimelate epimerase [Luteococcus sp. Sow4_B9]|uniref:diaminopimelate epimerase n=1 Tax=Luteococcus sp. Sow4_B9 TaxID=3438792 RepID=UPI003F9582DE
MRTWKFAKGHGTMNDFVILRDRHAMVKLTDDDVRQLCDRRAGIGGDGLLRVTLASSIPGWQGDPDLWFMDYRNSDGSIAEMCGNGLRVFVRYLLEEDLASGEEIVVATRAGVKRAWPLMDGRIRTDLGSVSLADAPVRVVLGALSWDATEVNVGNPHAVCFVEESQQLATLDLSHAPQWQPAERFPDGANVEFVEVLADDHIRMRVHERGSGETMSCGTGTVAAAAAHCRRLGITSAEVRVDIPGGWLEVGLDDGQATLTGPAVLVAHGEAQLADLS